MLLRNVVATTLIAITPLLTHCGADSNINQLFKTSADDERLDSLLAKGRILYDRGKHDEAATYVEKAVAINSNSENAATLFAYVKLGQAGIDPFCMTRKMMPTTEGEESSDEECAPISSSSSDSSSAADALSSFSGLINITDADLEKMGTLDSGDGLFSGIPLLLPHTVSDPDNSDNDPRKTVPTLRYLNEAISATCAFVDDELHIEGDVRHECTAAPVTLKAPSKIRFLWALAHLSEAIAFNTVLLYEGAQAISLQQESSKSPDTNLFARVNKLDSTTFDLNSEENGIDAYLDSMSSIKTSVTSVFNTGKYGMLTGTLSDLTAVSNAFGAIPGIPSSVTDSVNNGLDSLKETVKKLNPDASEDDLSEQSNALQSQMNAEVNKKLKEAIEKNNTTAFSDEAIAALPAAEQAAAVEKKEEVCDSYKEITDYSEGSSISLPTGC